jgi:hypothetical protein
MGGSDDFQTGACTTSCVKKAIQFLLRSIHGDAQSCCRVNLLLLLQCSCIAEIIKHHNGNELSTKGAKYGEKGYLAASSGSGRGLVETLPFFLKINGGFMKVLHLLLLLAVQALLVLQLLFQAGVFGQIFLELSVQPLHRNRMTLLNPLESGLQFGSICMAEILQSIGQIAKKVLYLQN